MKAAAQPVPVRAGHISPIWRGLWVLAALAALGLFMLSLPFYLRPGPRNLTIDAVPVWIFALEFINSIALMAVALLSLGLAGLLFWRRAGDRMALFVSFFLLGYGTVLVGPLELLHQAHPALVGIDPGLIQRLVLFPSFMALLGLFPDGRFVPGWMRWTVLISLGLTPLYFGLPCCNQTQVNLWLATSVSIAPLIFVPLGGYAQIYRYRWVSTPVERQQTKWVLWGVALFLLLLALSSIPYQWMQSLPAGSVPPMCALSLACANGDRPAVLSA